MKVSVDRDLCIGVGNCTAIAPEAFELDEENKAVVIHPMTVDEDIVMSAAESCPENAIIVEDDDGHQLYP